MNRVKIIIDQNVDGELGRTVVERYFDNDVPRDEVLGTMLSALRYAGFCTWDADEHLDIIEGDA